MQEIVTKVLEVEKEAQQRIQEARNKAGEIRAQADREVQGKLEQAREQAARRAQEIVEQAEYDKTLQQSQEENELFFEQHEEEIDRAAEAVVQLIATPEWSS